MPHRTARTVEHIRMLRRLRVAKPRRRIPKQKQPDAIRLAYFVAIRDILRDAHAAVARHVVSQLADIVARAKAQRGDTRGDSAISARDAIDRAIAEFNRRHDNSELAQVAKKIADRTSDWQRVEWGKQVRAALGVDLSHMLSPDTTLGARVTEFTAINVSKIVEVSDAYFAQVEAATLEGVRSGRRWEDIAKDIKKRDEVSESRARTIARDQVGKLFATLNKVRQQDVGVTEFIWRTSHDARVRDEHAALDGETFEWANPPSEGIPGDPILCRCFPEPVFAGVLAFANEAA